MIVIIGSGIIGLFIANELLESGKKVTKLQELLSGESINLTFSDGKAKAKIVERKLN